MHISFLTNSHEVLLVHISDQLKEIQVLSMSDEMKILNVTKSDHTFALCVSLFIMKLKKKKSQNKEK
jgi:hypothetical protein